MSVTWTWLLNLLAKVLVPLIGLLTPLISDGLKTALSDLYLKALKTENPWDDYFVGMLLDILGIPRPTPTS